MAFDVKKTKVQAKVMLQIIIKLLWLLLFYFIIKYINSHVHWKFWNRNLWLRDLSQTFLMNSFGKCASYIFFDWCNKKYQNKIVVEKPISTCKIITGTNGCRNIVLLLWKNSSLYWHIFPKFRIITKLVCNIFLWGLFYQLHQHADILYLHIKFAGLTENWRTPMITFSLAGFPLTLNACDVSKG